MQVTWEQIALAAMFGAYAVFSTIVIISSMRRALKEKEKARQAADSYAETLQYELHSVRALCVEIAAICASYGTFTHDENSNVLHFEEYAHLSKRDH